MSGICRWNANFASNETTFSVKKMLLDARNAYQHKFTLSYIFRILLSALYTIPGNTPMFWQKISRKVTSRTAQECQLKHQGQALVSTKKASSVKKVSSKEKNDTGVKGA